jgi:hypothetical protein
MKSAELPAPTKAGCSGLKNRIRDFTVYLVPSRRPPFVTLRYPYRDRRRMLTALGRELNAEVSWAESDAPAPDGEMASIFAAAQNIHKFRHYLPVYESALSTFRSRPVRMLEIGVARGGSLHMWRRYLHPESAIVGIDIDPATKRFDDPSERLHVRIGGQQDASFLQSVVSELGPFDVILDDGSHMTSHQVQTFRYLFANGLASGGVYIVEDIAANYWKAFRDSPMSFVDFAKWLVDAMHAHYQVTDKEISFREGDSQRLTELPVPLATTLVEKVEFYDSIAVIHRAKGCREVPRTVYR